MKRILALVLVLAMVFTGCALDKGGSAADNAGENQNKGITVNRIDFVKLDFEKLTEDKKATIEKIKSSRGYYVWEDNGAFIIFIASGEKPTGGFGIDVKQIEDNEGKTNILVAETSPSPGDMVTAAVTYPFVIVKASGITDDFNIENTEGKGFDALSAAGGQTPTGINGLFVRFIDSSFAEIIIHDEPRAFMTTEVEDKIKGIDSGDRVLLDFEANKHGQLVIKSIELID